MLFSKKDLHFYFRSLWGHLGGSVGEASGFGLGHDLMACESEACIRLCADTSESGAVSDSVSVSLCPSPTHTHTYTHTALSKINKHVKKLKNKKKFRTPFYDTNLIQESQTQPSHPATGPSLVFHYSAKINLFP